MSIIELKVLLRYSNKGNKKDQILIPLTPSVGESCAGSSLSSNYLLSREIRTVGPRTKIREIGVYYENTNSFLFVDH